MDSLTTPSPALAHIDSWLFDLDNTLYSPHSNLFPQIHERMGLYLMQKFGLSEQAAADLRFDYFKKYGTTLRGLMVEHQIIPEDFMDFVHAVDLGDIGPSAALTNALTKLKGRKVIFTNADRNHAQRILEHLKISHFFEGIFDIADGDYLCKPEIAPYKAVLNRFGFAAGRTAMVDDMQANLKPAAELGITTIWLRHAAEWLRHKPDEPHHYPHCHIAIGDLVPFLEKLGSKELPSLIKGQQGDRYL